MDPDCVWKLSSCSERATAFSCPSTKGEQFIKHVLQDSYHLFCPITPLRRKQNTEKYIRVIRTALNKRGEISLRSTFGFSFGSCSTWHHWWKGIHDLYCSSPQRGDWYVLASLFLIQSRVTPFSPHFNTVPPRDSGEGCGLGHIFVPKSNRVRETTSRPNLARIRQSLRFLCLKSNKQRLCVT